MLTCAAVASRGLKHGAVAAAGSAPGVFVRQLHRPAVALALPQAGRLDDLLHQLLKRTLDAVLRLGAGLCVDGGQSKTAWTKRTETRRLGKAASLV